MTERWPCPVAGPFSLLPRDSEMAAGESNALKARGDSGLARKSSPASRAAPFGGICEADHAIARISQPSDGNSNGTGTKQYPPGTIIIIKPQHSLYLVKDNGTALRYSIGIGADCDSSAALLVVERKDRGPANTVPVTTALDRPSPPQQTRDGSPAAAPTFYLGDTPCRVGATNLVTAVGQNPSTGGFQLFADDMLDLYDRVSVGTKVAVTN